MPRPPRAAADPDSLDMAACIAARNLRSEPRQDLDDGLDGGALAEVFQHPFATPESRKPRASHAKSGSPGRRRGPRSQGKRSAVGSDAWGGVGFMTQDCREHPGMARSKYGCFAGP